MRTFVIAGFYLSILVRTAQGQTFPLTGFDSYVTKALAQWRVPGVAIAVVRGDSIVLLRGYGVKQAGRREPVTARTMFEIGSTSKAFSSAILAMLVDEGRLDWDDRVVDRLPGFELKDPFVTGQVTLRDLLSHRTGLVGGHNAYTTVSRAEVVRRNRFLDPVIPFRSRYEYSNPLFATAGEVAAAVTGKPWEQLLAERITGPLGMRETTTDITKFFDSTRFTHCFYCALPSPTPSITDARPGTDVAMPHTLRNDSVTVIPWQSYDNAVSAGSVISNVAEMAQWLRLLVNQGRYGGRELIKPATFREMHKAQSVLRPTGWIAMVDSLSPNTHFWNYGLGWRMNDYRGKKIVWHTGGIVGFLAYVGLVPEERLGIVVLSNGDLGYELLPQSLAMRITDLFLGTPVGDWSGELFAAMAADRQRQADAEAKLVASRVQGTKPTRPLDQLAGRYRSDLYGDAVVTVAGDRLNLEIVEGAKGELRHWNNDVFRLYLDATNPGPYFASFDTTGLSITGLGTFERLQ
jgi:CubicO group peptidase (beta-lactamase class C family)